VIGEVLVELRAPHAPKAGAQYFERIESLCRRIEAVAVPHMLSSVRRRLKAGGLGAVDPTVESGRAMHALGPLTLYDTVRGWWLSDVPETVDAVDDVVREMRHGAAAGLADHVVARGLQASSVTTRTAPRSSTLAAPRRSEKSRTSGIQGQRLHVGVLLGRRTQ
jgi:hypothetical protein